MNLTQFALMTYRTTGVGQAAADYFSRAARTGDESPASLREAERVVEFCGRVQRATPRVLPGGEDGRPGHEGNDLWCEANEVAVRMRDFIRRETGAADEPPRNPNHCICVTGPYPGCPVHGDANERARSAEALRRSEVDAGGPRSFIAHDAENDEGTGT